ncbi:hypothetical protein [Pedobacter sp. SYSU D00535]|uniref:hypothetical protein n=1 Tax=Pedobacter sp. SYSU D00535 TaxID=2810308 RepID=UPI001A97C7AE|nr:hypothetical protein [Pedobacter sp. SYSU D00535]
MKSNRLILYIFLLFITVFAACKKERGDDPIIDADTEHSYIRVLVNDELTNELSLITPATGKVEKFTARHPKSALYTTASGRYAALVHTSFNFVEIFDSGLEFHGDHVDTKATPKFAALTGEANKPTHFKTKGTEIITFNDGDGTLSIANENNFHTAGAKMNAINAGGIAHHGAMTKFDNGNYAITVKDGSVAGSLPERVKLINASGAQVAASTIQTTGIHGNASDGKVSVFGSGSGLLIVDQSGTQRLLPHPAGFGTAWFGTILEGGSDGKFIGYTAAKGAYFINTTTNTITPIIESTDIMQCKIDRAEKNLLVLLHDGTLKLYDLANGALKREGRVLAATAKDETKKPTLEATGRYAYITLPKAGEVHQVNLSRLAEIKKLAVSAAPYRLTIFGFENSDNH